MASDANLEATASTTIPLADIAPKCWLHITDISLQGDTAVRRHLDLAPSETNDVKQLLLSLPDLADSHARIYDYVAGEVTPQLADYLQPLFHKAPGVQRNSPRLSKSDLRSQWAGESIPTPEWNPLYVPCCDPLVEKQYDRLGRGPKVSLFTCKSIPGDRLLVLYERPPEYKALGPVFAASYPQATPQSSARLRIVFVKLLLLALSQLHIERLTDVCYRTFPSTPHELLYRGEADVPQTIARIRNCTEYCKHVDQLVAMTRLTIDNLELEFLNAVPTTLAEYLLEVSASSSFEIYIYSFSTL
ncbi:MAG: hypothetical protein L6R42_008350 [Xanthoria sp. 1 TBL-2021]|nr:MAG: hypothetical protein L6R42_008350 [Xanthoria sp. 1 TBL-2021]